MSGVGERRREEGEKGDEEHLDPGLNHTVNVGVSLKDVKSGDILYAMVCTGTYRLMPAQVTCSVSSALQP